MAIAVIVVLVLVCLSLLYLVIVAKRRSEEFGRFIRHLYRFGTIDLSETTGRALTGGGNSAREPLSDIWAVFEGSW